MVDYPSLLISGSLLIIAITFFYLWLRAENKLIKEKNK